jgi:hypothetical protein
MLKNFIVWREHYPECCAVVFDLLNHASWGNPSTTNINANGDARFFEVSLKYVY